MGRVVRWIEYAAVWIGVVGIIALLTIQTRAQREVTMVGSMEIVIVDSLKHGKLISSSVIERLISDNNLDILGTSATSVPLQKIEKAIERHGFVAGVKAYVNHKGEVTIEVKQRRPVARLLLDGHNCYITSDGFIFNAPESTALNTAIITGGYSPLFEAGYEGYIEDYKELCIEKIEREIERVEQEKMPIYERERENAEDRREVRKRFINRSTFESKDDFTRRVVALRSENQRLRDLYTYRQKVIDAELKVLEQRQEQYRREQKKAEKKCEDIYNLITFVEMVERDDFWRSEITQIDLEDGDCGERDMRVSVAVRSGSFIVTLGDISSDREEAKGKLKRLRAFYDEALVRVGWDRYRQINIEYKNQVVCRR